MTGVKHALADSTFPVAAYKASNYLAGLFVLLAEEHRFVLAIDEAYYEFLEDAPDTLHAHIDPNLREKAKQNASQKLS